MIPFWAWRSPRFWLAVLLACASGACGACGGSVAPAAGDPDPDAIEAGCAWRCPDGELTCAVAVLVCGDGGAP